MCVWAFCCNACTVPEAALLPVSESRAMVIAEKVAVLFHKACAIRGAPKDWLHVTRMQSALVGLATIHSPTREQRCHWFAQCQPFAPWVGALVVGLGRCRGRR